MNLSRRKALLVTQRVIKDSHGEAHDALSRGWSVLLRQAGFEVLPVPNGVEYLEEHPLVRAAEGLVLTGGNDIDPRRYGGRAEDASSVSLERDETEFHLLEVARKRAWPVLGVCRGMQLINVALGGKLTKLSDGMDRPHVARDHDLISASEEWPRAFPEIRRVNSFHDFGVLASQVAPDLTTLASAPDGVIEAVSHREYRWVGIQWHPERIKPFRDAEVRLVQDIFGF